MSAAGGWAAGWLRNFHGQGRGQPSNFPPPPPPRLFQKGRTAPGEKGRSGAGLVPWAAESQSRVLCACVFRDGSSARGARAFAAAF